MAKPKKDISPRRREGHEDNTKGSRLSWWFFLILFVNFVSFAPSW